jgi:hypothetical protein
MHVEQSCGADTEELAAQLTNYLDTELSALRCQRGGDRRQRAGRHVRRARKPRRLFPAEAGHDAVRCGQLHQPRHRQGAGKRPSRAGSRARTRSGGGEESDAKQGQADRGARPYCVNLNEKAKAGKDRPADRPRAARSSAPSRSSAAVPRTTRSMSAMPASARPPSPRGWPARSSRARCPRCCASRSSTRSTWARCWPAPAIAATSRSGSRPS